MSHCLSKHWLSVGSVAPFLPQVMCEGFISSMVPWKTALMWECQAMGIALNLSSVTGNVEVPLASALVLLLG